MTVTPITTVTLDNSFDEQRQILNSVIDRFNTLGVSSEITVTGGTINGATIGATTPTTGFFTYASILNNPSSGNHAIRKSWFDAYLPTSSGDIGVTGSFSTGLVFTVVDNTISNSKIASNAIDTTNIIASAITTAKINNGAVTADKISNNAITTAKILDGAVTADKISNGVITGQKVADATITLTNISNAVGLSVVGNATNSTNTHTDIVASNDHQVLRRSGTSIGFGSINLGQTNAVTGTLPVTRGGTGLTTFTAGTNYVSPTVATSFTKQQNFNNGTLTDGATITWDLSEKQCSQVTLAGNRTISNPTNMVANGTYILIVKQDETGSRTLSFDTTYKWIDGIAPTLSTAANSIDILTFVSDGTNMYGGIAKGFA